MHADSVYKNNNNYNTISWNIDSIVGKVSICHFLFDGLLQCCIFTRLLVFLNFGSSGRWANPSITKHLCTIYYMFSKIPYFGARFPSANISIHLSDPLAHKIGITFCKCHTEGHQLLPQISLLRVTFTTLLLQCNTFNSEFNSLYCSCSNLGTIKNNSSAQRHLQLEQKIH